MSVCCSAQSYLSEEILALCSSPLAVLRSSRGACRFKCWHRGWCWRQGLHWTSERGLELLLWAGGDTDCLPVNSQGTFIQFEFTRAASVLLTWIFLCACDKWLITRKNWFWQGRSQNTLCLFPHGHAQIPPRWKKIRLLSGFFQGKSKTSPWRWP